jgi:hypothetical protein
MCALSLLLLRCAGDFVDRGAWGVETLAVLLAWKIALPRHVYLLRGNHESSYCTKYYGFQVWGFGGRSVRRARGAVAAIRQRKPAACIRQQPREAGAAEAGAGAGADADADARR